MGTSHRRAGLGWVLAVVALVGCGPDRERNRGLGGGGGGLGAGDAQAGAGGAGGAGGADGGGAAGGGRPGAVPGDQQDDPGADRAPFDGEGEADPGENDDPGPQPEPAPEPVEVPCEGAFVLTSWVVDVAPFGTQYVNPMLEQDIASGEMVATFQVLGWEAEVGGPALKWVDQVELGDDGGGAGWGPDRRVPESPAMAVEVDGRLVQTTEERGGHVGVYVSNSEYPAPPLAWSQVDVAIIGVFTPDCALFSGRLSGAFLDGEDFSIPGRADYDTDGDGSPDAFWLESEIQAEPWGLIE